MKKIYASILSFSIAVSASAQFTGSYAPENWSTVLSAGSNGSVNSSGAPSSITVVGSNDPGNTASTEPINTDFTIVAASEGQWSFTWSYHSNDNNNDPQFDIAGILIDGVFTPLTSTTGSIDQSGTFTGMPVTAGTVIGFRVSATNNITGNATFTISNFSPPGSTLAAALTNFRAKTQAENVVLNWSTRDEQNLAGFTIERSANGSDFQHLAYTTARNQQGSQTYETADAAPLSGTSYYRLRIKEVNGTEKLSPIVSVRRNGLVNVQVSPNPVKSFVRITLQSVKQGRERIDVLDATGRVLQSKQQDVTIGQQTITLNQLPAARGLYYIRVADKVVSFIKE